VLEYLYSSVWRQLFIFSQFQFNMVVTVMTGMWIVNSRMSGGCRRNMKRWNRLGERKNQTAIQIHLPLNGLFLFNIFLCWSGFHWLSASSESFCVIFVSAVNNAHFLCLPVYFCLPFIHAVMWYQQKYWFSHQKVLIILISYACVQIVQFSEEADNDQVWYKRRSFGWEQVENPTAGACKTSSIYTGKLCICAALLSRFSP